MRSFASLVVAIGLGLSTVAASGMTIDPRRSEATPPYLMPLTAAAPA